MLGRTTLFVAIALVLSYTLIPITDLSAGNEWNDRCYNQGFSDGQNEPFSQATHDHCGEEEDGADAYYKGFIDGCISVEGNTRDVCGSTTDA